MEKDWERLDYNHLDFKSIKNIFKKFLPQKEVSDFSILSGGLRNTNYLISFYNTTEKLVLRIYTEENKEPLKEYNLFKLLKDKIPFPEFYYSGFWKDINRHFAITQYLEGITLDKCLNDFPDKSAEELGEFLNIIHSNKYTEIGLLNEKLEITEHIFSPDKTLESFIIPGLENTIIKKDLVMI